MGNKMEAGAAREYDNLHAHVRTLGEAAFRRLLSSEKMALVDDPVRHEDFLFRAGVEALSPEMRNAIPDVDAFRHGRDDFIRRRGWTALNEEDRNLAGSPKALAKEDTEEKLALLERLGRAALSAEQRRDLEARLQGVTRLEANTPDLFQQKYGEAALRDYLKALGIAAEVVAPPVYLSRSTPGLGYWFASDARGSLLRGNKLLYHVQATKRDRESAFAWPYAFVLRRAEADGNRSRYSWRIAGREDGGEPLL